MSPKRVSFPNLDELIWVEDLRSNQRFIVRRPLSGELGGEHADVLDLSTGGFRIAHRVQVRIGATTRLSIRARESLESIPFDTKVVWSRLSGERDPDHALLYTSGMRIESEADQIGDKVTFLLRSHCRPDTTSMETKRLQALERLMDRMTVERELLLDVDPTKLLQSYEALADVSRLDINEKEELIRNARKRLALTSAPSAWNRDVLAAWESVGGTVGLETIEAARKILSAIDRFVQQHD